MRNTKHKKSPKALASVVIYRISDEASWKLALQLLEAAKIEPVAEGGAGFLEICVSQDNYKAAEGIIKGNKQLREQDVSALLGQKRKP